MLGAMTSHGVFDLIRIGEKGVIRYNVPACEPAWFASHPAHFFEGLVRSEWLLSFLGFRQHFVLLYEALYLYPGGPSSFRQRPRRNPLPSTTFLNLPSSPVMCRIGCSVAGTCEAQLQVQDLVFSCAHGSTCIAILCACGGFGFLTVVACFVDVRIVLGKLLLRHASSVRGRPNYTFFFDQ